MIISDLFPQIGTKIPLNARLEKTANFTTGVIEIDRILRSLDPKSRNHLLNLGVGVEIEVESAIPMDTKGSKWDITEDPSLRNNGLEFRTKFGVRLHDVWKELKWLEDKFASIRKVRSGLFDFTERTSIHVHVDVRSFTPDQLENFALLYTLFENPLFAFADATRKHNIFCVPLRESGQLGMYGDLGSYLSNWSRYCAFNLNAVSKFGTVEFRHMSGNGNAEKIFMWALLIGLLQTAAWQYDRRTLEAEIYALKSSSMYDLLFKSVFPGCSDVLTWESQDFDDAVSDTKLLFITENAR